MAEAAHGKELGEPLQDCHEDSLKGVHLLSLIWRCDDW
jgi:hypothetical protein